MITGKQQKDIWLNIVRSVIHCAPQMCITCGHFNDGVCQEFNSEVPPDFAENITDCDSWKTMDLTPYCEDMKNIPF